MKKFHWFLYALQLSSALRVSPEKRREEMARYGNTDGGSERHPPNRDDAWTVHRPVQLRNFDRPETPPAIGYNYPRDRTPPTGSRDSAAECLGATADSEAGRLHENVLPDPKNGGVNEGRISYQVEEGLQSMPLTEASPSIQMDKMNSWSPRLSVTERRHWFTSLNPSSKTRSTNRRRPLSSSYPSQSLHSSSFQNPSPSPNPSSFPNPSPSLNPSSYSSYSALPYPSPSPSYSALPYPYTISYPSPSSRYSVPSYPYRISYPSSSSAQALHNLVSPTPSPYHNDPFVNISPQPQPPLPSANLVQKKMQAAAVVTSDNRVDGNKNLMAKFRTVITVASSSSNQVDYVTKTYLMVVDEHGMMHMNSTAGTAYWDNTKHKIR